MSTVIQVLLLLGGLLLVVAILGFVALGLSLWRDGDDL